MKEFLIIANYLIGAGELVLAWYFWKTNSGSAIRKVMVLLGFSTGMWVILTGTFVYEFVLVEYNDIGIGLIYLFGALLVTALVHLIILFPHPVFYFDRLHAILLYIPVVIFGYAAVFTDTIIQRNFSPINQPEITYPGPIHDFYNAYLLLLFVFAIALLIFKIRRFDGISRWNAKTLLYGLLLGGVPIVILDLILTNFDIYPNAAIASLFTVIWLGTTTYIIIRK